MRKVLACTFHAIPSQEEGWVAQIELALPVLRRLYDEIHVSATEITDKTTVSRGKYHKSLVDFLNEKKVNCSVLNGKLGDNHRAALSMSLSNAHLDRIKSRIHYCDFDRILVWAINYPRELEEILHLSEKFTVLFPVRRGLWESAAEFKADNLSNAWISHPLTQKATEIVINYGINWIIKHITTNKVHTKCTIDPLGTSHIASFEVTNTILKNSRCNSYPQTEWAAIIVSELFTNNDRVLSQIRCEEVDGLFFETLEIHKYLNRENPLLNYSKMFDEIESSRVEIYKRISIAKDMIEDFVSVLANYKLLDNEIITFALKLKENLESLKEKVEIINVDSGLRKLLKEYYIQFHIDNNLLKIDKSLSK